MELKQKILEYITPGDINLKALDNNYRGFYTGVTLNYITYKVLKARYRKKNVARALLELHTENKIKSLFCSNVENIVFMSNSIGYWNYEHVNGENNYRSDVGKYSFFINYLNQYINV